VCDGQRTKFGFCLVFPLVVVVVVVVVVCMCVCVCVCVCVCGGGGGGGAGQGVGCSLRQRHPATVGDIQSHGINLYTPLSTCQAIHINRRLPKPSTCPFASLAGDFVVWQAVG
jgi:hypothetical protein